MLAEIQFLKVTPPPGARCLFCSTGEHSHIFFSSGKKDMAAFLLLLRLHLIEKEPVSDSVVMKRVLTIMKGPARIYLVGQTDVSSAEEQLTRDNQPKATNCRWDGDCTPAIPSYKLQIQFRALSCLKNTSLPKARQSLNKEVDLSDSR